MVWDNPALRDIAGLASLPSLQRAAVAGSLVEKLIDAFQHTPQLQSAGARRRRRHPAGSAIALNQMRRDAGLAPVEISHSPPGSPAWWDAMRG